MTDKQLYDSEFGTPQLDLFPDTLGVSTSFKVDYPITSEYSIPSNVKVSWDHVWPTTLRVYKLWEDAWLPEYGSQWAACFDLKASLRAFDEVTVYGNVSKKGKRTVDEYGALTLYSDERILVPTGLVFDLDANKSLRIHPRSGLALKNGIVVANCEGIVDSDYVNQTFVMLHNISHEPFHIRDGDRIAQGEVVPMEQVTFEVVDEEPGLKTDRSGGFGSTGV